MLNDITLSSLVHLFALIGAKSGIAVEASEKLLNNYLFRHFGLRNTASYFDLYRDLRSFYEDCPEVDKDTVTGQICSKIKGKISHDELTLMLLRLMEFCKLPKSADFDTEGTFRTMAPMFDVNESLFSDYLAFVLDREQGNVRMQSFQGYSCTIKTLWISSSNLLLFTCEDSEELFFNDMPLLPGTFQIWHKSGVLKSRRGAPLYYSSVFLPYGKASGESISYVGKDVNFRFPGSDNGLHNMSFSLHSGELVAIMGGSGTGKTTLLSIMNGTLKPQSGSLAINGHPIEEQCVKELIGFVPQDDLLIEELTVYQNLYYTAKLCYGSLTEEEIDRKVTAVLCDLCLDFAKDLVVGSPLNKTISGGQRKRLNIALELIREPAVLFLDEPTSGLSSADTENVMGLLKEQTDKGKLVVVNIHQPSSDVYKLFDRLWLLDKGGYPVFDGNPIAAVTYFKHAANYADSDTSNCPVCGNVNPEIVLNIIDEQALDNSGRPSGVRKTTPVQWHDLYLSSRDEVKTDGKAAAVPESGQKKPGALRQLLIFLERNVKAKLTNVQYLAITLLEAPILAVICGLLTHYAPASGYSVMDNKNMVTYFFMAVIVAIFLGMSGSAEEIIRDRTILKRERFLNLSYTSYMLSKIIYSALVSLLQTALFILVGNLIMGLHGMFLMWWLILFVSSLLSSLIGLLLSQCLNSVVAIYISIPILLIPQILLCGLVVSFSDLNGNSTTDNVPVIGDIIPSRWAFEAIAVGSFRYNAYEKPFFEMDRERYESLYLRESHIRKMEESLETIRLTSLHGETADAEHMEIIRNGLPRVEAACGKSYTGDYGYESLTAYLSEAKTALEKRANRLTLDKDRILNALIKEKGSREIVRLKRNSYNLQLENVLTGASAERAVEVVGGHLIPRVGYVFLTPQSNNGRAPFYSSSKKIAGKYIPTLWFNVGILIFMSFLLTFALLLNIPEKTKKQY